MRIHSRSLNMTTPWSTLPFEFPRYTKVILVLDVVESVRLMKKDERDFVQRWHYFVEHARKNVLPRHGGRMLKSLGDGLMLEFASAQGAIKSALALQAFCQADNEGQLPAKQMHLRVGAHLAEFVSDEHDIYGSDVNLTARIATLAGPGEIVISAQLRGQIAPGIDADVEDLGECHLKHVEEPIRAYRVGPLGLAPVISLGNDSTLNLRPTIAVIPFAMEGADASLAVLGEAVADEIITALSRSNELHVISRLSTTVFKGRTDAVDDIRVHLGAKYILSGLCRASGSQMSLFVELIDTKNGQVVWADRVKTNVVAIFNADDGLARGIVASVTSHVIKRELSRARSQSLPNLEGYTLLFGAIALMHRLSLTDFERARDMLEALIARAPRQSTPKAWMAKWHVMRVSQGWTDDPKRDGILALDFTKRALDEDPTSALALTIDGLVHTNLFKQLDVAQARYTEAVEQNPNEPLAWLLKGTLHAFMGDGAQAVNDTEMALSLSPLDPMRYYFDSLAATAAMSAGRYERAIELAKRSLRANKTHASTLRALAISQVQVSQIDEARATAALLMQVEPNLTVAKFIKYSPASAYALGALCAKALREAGVPE